MSKAFPILMAFLLLALSVVAAAAGMADIYRREAVNLIGEWDVYEDEEGPPAWAWEQVQRYLWLASRLAPFDAQIPGNMVQLHERRVGAAPAPESGLDLERALGYYRQSLALRPAWPYTWVDIALLKITRQRIDAEFALAMQRALTLGPWQKGVQASIASGGLTVWDQLPATLQTELEDTIARGLSSNSQLMMAVAKRFDLLASDGS